MNRKVKALLAAEGVLCLLAALVGKGVWSPAFPFDLLAGALRNLSLQGGGANAFALAVYWIIGLVPVAVFALQVLWKKQTSADCLLILLSVVLFAALYLMINPALMGAYGLDMGNIMMGGIIYSVLVAYIVLKVTQNVRTAKGKKLYVWMKGLLVVLCMVLVAAAVYGGVNGAVQNIRSLNEGNTDTGNLFLSKAVLVIKNVAASVVYLMEVYVVFAVFPLLCALSEKDAEKAENQARLMEKRCRVSLSVTVLLPLGVNLVQWALSASVRAVNFTVFLPVESLVLLLAALVLVRVMQDMKRLQHENESFI